MRIDYHVHTSFSDDCMTSPRDQCLRALDLGLDEIGITDHFDYRDNLGRFQGCQLEDLEDYAADLRSLRAEFEGRLTVRLGIEAGQAHERADYAGICAKLDALNLDFILGSIHDVYGERIVPHDNPSRSADFYYRRYFRHLLALVDSGGIDVIAHLDVIKRYACEFFGSFDPRDYREEICSILKLAVEREIAVEVNTSGWRYACGEVHPAPLILRWYRELGGQLVTTGSDAHFPMHVGSDLERARKLLAEVGFEHLTVFEHRQPRVVQLVST